MQDLGAAASAGSAGRRDGTGQGDLKPLVTRSTVSTCKAPTQHAVRGCLAADDGPFGTARQDVLAVLVRAADVELYIHPVAAILNDGRSAEALHAVAGEDRPVELKGHLLGQVVEVPSKLGRNGGRQEAVGDQPAVPIDIDVMDPMIVGDAREGAHVIDIESPT